MSFGLETLKKIVLKKIKEKKHPLVSHRDQSCNTQQLKTKFPLIKIKQQYPLTQRLTYKTIDESKTFEKVKEYLHDQRRLVMRSLQRQLKVGYTTSTNENQFQKQNKDDFCTLKYLSKLRRRLRKEISNQMLPIEELNINLEKWEKINLERIDYSTKIKRKKSILTKKNQQMNKNILKSIHTQILGQKMNKMKLLLNHKKIIKR